MKKILTLILLIAASNVAISQITQFTPGMVNTMGGSGTIGAINYNYTVGEPYVQFGGQACDSLFAGFQHMAEDSNIRKKFNIITSGPTTFCLNSSVQLSTPPLGNTFVWYKNGTNVVGNAATYNVTESGNYTCRVINSVCGDTIFSNNLPINVLSPPIPQICLVTADSLGDHNVIIWDKTIYTNVASFRVYRNCLGTYLPLATIPYDSLSQYIDTDTSVCSPNGGDPDFSSYRYRLTAIDTCGNESNVNDSYYHRSIFIQQNQQNFSWNPYESENGTPTPTQTNDYLFYRDNLGNGTWTQLANVTGTATTDPDYATYPNARYRIDGIGFNCEATRVPVNTTRSNIKPNQVPVQLLSLTATIVASTCTGQCDGAAQALASGGAGNYSYNWMPGNLTSANPTGLCAGTYTVTVTDGGAATATQNIVITANPLPSVSLSIPDTTLCINGGVPFILNGGSPLGGTYGGTAVNGGTFDPTLVSAGIYVITYTYTDNNNCSNTANDSIEATICTNIENSYLKEFVVYPNPANESLTIINEGYMARPNTTVKIYDMLGALVYNEQMISKRMFVNVQTYAKGVYTIAIESNEQQVYKKLMVE